MSNETLQLIRAYEALPLLEKESFVRELLQRLALVELQSRGINETQAADLRARLKTVAEDWDRPEMSIYDDIPTR